MATSTAVTILDPSRAQLVPESVDRPVTSADVRAQALEQYSYDRDVINKAVMLGDMKKMDGAMRLDFYRAVCLSVGLNPLTQPFTPLERQDKTVWLYANATATQQLGKLHQVGFRELRRVHETVGGEPLYRVEVVAFTPDGRSVPSQAVVSLTKKKKEQRGTWPDGNPKFVDALDADGEPLLVPLRGEALANALMRADTKALRRATLALIGLGWIQSEFEGQHVRLDLQTGDLTDESTGLRRRLLSERPEEQGKSTDDHIADLYGDRTPRGEPPRQYGVTPQGTPRPHADQRLPDDHGALAIEVQITDLLYAQGHDDAAVAAWWEALRAKHSDLSPGYLNYVLEQLQGKPATSREIPPRPPRAPSATSLVEETLAAFQAVTQAQQALGWTGQEVKAWERRQVRRFRTTYTKFSVDMLRTLVDELEALRTMEDPGLDTTQQGASVPTDDTVGPAAASVATMPNSSPSSEEEHVRAFPPDECGSIREDLAWFAQGLEDVTLKAEALALINDPMTPLDVLIKKRADVQDRLAQERLVPEDAEQGLPF